MSNKLIDSSNLESIKSQEVVSKIKFYHTYHTSKYLYTFITNMCSNTIHKLGLRLRWYVYMLSSRITRKRAQLLVDLIISNHTHWTGLWNTRALAEKVHCTHKIWNNVTTNIFFDTVNPFLALFFLPREPKNNILVKNQYGYQNIGI